MDSEKTDVESERVAKKRKLAAAGSFGNIGSQVTSSSFADVLERLKEESGGIVSASHKKIGLASILLMSIQPLKVGRTTGRDPSSCPWTTGRTNSVRRLSSVRQNLEITPCQISIPAD
jgi:hypothetical protein